MSRPLKKRLWIVIKKETVEALASRFKKFTRRLQINPRAIDVHMSHVGGQKR